MKLLPRLSSSGYRERPIWGYWQVFCERDVNAHKKRIAFWRHPTLLAMLTPNALDRELLFEGGILQDKQEK